MNWQRRMYSKVILLMAFAVLMVGCSPLQAESPVLPSAPPPATTVTTPTAPVASTPPVESKPISVQVSPYAGQAVIRPDVESTRREKFSSFSMASSQAGYTITPMNSPLRNIGLNWVNDELLIVDEGQNGNVHVVDLKAQHLNALDTKQNTYQIAKGFTADQGRIAYTRGNQLVIQDRVSGKEQSWTVAVIDDKVQQIGTELLTWSPDGRYLVGSWYPLWREGLGFLTSKLWMLDYESGELRSVAVASNKPHYDPVWSPNGRQVVFKQYFGYKGVPSPIDYLMVELPMGSLRTVQSTPAHGVLYDFRWDEAGMVQTVPQLPWPNQTRLLLYNPVRKQYEHLAGEDSSLVYTELHFASIDGQIIKRIDLRPAFQEKGLTPDDSHYLSYSWQWSPAYRFIIIDGVLNSNGDQAPPAFSAIIDAVTGSVSLTKLAVPESALIENAGQWRGNQVLTSSQSGLNILDLTTQQRTRLLRDVQVHRARWQGDRVVYVTSREVGIVYPGGRRQLLYTVTEGEEISSTQFSPSTQYLAVVKRKTAGGDAVAVEVVNLMR